MTNILIAEAPFQSIKHKHQLTEELIEKRSFENIFFGTQGVFSLYSMGRPSGLVIESGDQITQFVPVCDGYKLSNAVERLDFGGMDLTEFL